MSIESVGFIGLGIMGMPMARNIIKAGYPVVAYNRSHSRANELASEGARVVFTPKEVAENCPMVITMVPDTPDLESVVLGQNSVIEGISSDAVLIDMSTIAPSTTRAISKMLKAKGAHMLDAPVSGGSWGAIDGTLSIMVGGDKEIFERCTPLFQSMGKDIVHVGSNGMGQVTKLVNQVLVAGTMNAVAEALVFAKMAGADLESTIKAVVGGAAGSWQLRNLGQKIIDGDFSPGFKVRLQQKDLRLILEAAREMQLSLPVTGFICQLYAALESGGLGDEGTQAIIKVYEHLAGVEARKYG